MSCQAVREIGRERALSVKQVIYYQELPFYCFSPRCSFCRILIIIVVYLSDACVLCEQHKKQ